MSFERHREDNIDMDDMDDMDDDSSSRSSLDADDSDSDDFLMLSTSSGDGGVSAGTTTAATTTTVRTTHLYDGSTSTSHHHHHHNNTDREALVRKKLLENFYGKSTTDGVTTTGSDGTILSRPSHRSSSSGGGGGSGGNRSKSMKTNQNINNNNVDDIDSKAFDIHKFVTNHIQSSSVPTLLEVEEQLSLQVRTYDSTMQTLVYENYTKFIDVTNAIKSIGTTVTTTNEEQIQQLITCTNTIHRTSRMMMMMDDTTTSTGITSTTGSTSNHYEIGTIRQQVVEKIRIQRLLQRLHTLFVLPQTIRQYIQQQQYTMAIAKYQHASMILAQYNDDDPNPNNNNNNNNINNNVVNDSNSTKLESFSAITNECLVVLQQLFIQLQNQFYYWSGSRSTMEEFVPTTATLRGIHPDPTMDEDYNNNRNNEGEDEKLEKENDNSILRIPQELPKSMIEIYESARALSMLHEIFPKSHHSSGDGMGNDSIVTSTTIENRNDDDWNPEDVYSMSLNAATRLLDRLLDAHSIQIQEYKFMMLDPNDPSNNHSTSVDDYNDYSSNNNSTGSLLGIIQEQQQHQQHQQQQQQPNIDGTTVLDENTNYLIPQNVLVAILECATLYKTTFKNSSTDHDVSEQNYYLIEFITESYTTFMTHVRSILLQEEGMGGSGGSSGIPSHENDDTNLASRNDEATSFDISPEEISKALTVLVQYVQIFTNRLVDEVYLNVDFTNQLMRQAIDLASSLVRRRVDNQFRTLRYSIVNECLLPFTNRIVVERERIIKEKSSSGNSSSILDNSSIGQALPEIIQIASSTLSDCLQLVDDTIRSVYADTSSSTTKNNDGNTVGIVVPSDVQDAVQVSTYRLVSWLANAFEIIVGGDPTDYNHIAQAPQPTPDEQNSGNEAVNLSTKAVANEAIGDTCEDELLALLYTARENIYQDGAIHSDIVLSIIELCRLSETLVPQQIEQSLQYGGGKKKPLSSQRDLFPSSQHDVSKTTSTASFTRNGTSSSSSSVQILQRFRVAGSRIFTILIMNTAYEATYHLLSNVTTNSETIESNVRRPSDNSISVVQYAKILSLQCATLFGGTKRAGPVPIWDDTIFNSTLISAAGMLSNRKSGLYLDVERMFKEKVSIYPHPSDVLEYSRDTAMFLYFKIVLRSWYENIREYSALSFSSDEYMQMQIDTIFIRYIIPHYLSNDFHDPTKNGTNGRTAVTSLMNDILEVMDDRYHRASADNNEYGQNDDMQRNARNIVRSFMVSVESDTKVANSFIIKES